MTFSLDQYPGRNFNYEQKTYLYFGGTAYLGLPSNEAFMALYVKNTQKFGAQFGSSRKANVRIAVYEEAEKELAALCGSPAAVTLSSGFLAGQLVRSQFLPEKYRLFYAPETHAALHLGPVQNDQTHEALLASLSAHQNTNDPRVPVLLFDTISFLEEHYSKYSWLQKLNLSNVILVADDSHGLGITGKDGSGSYPILQKLKPRELIVCSSLGKGFGIQGGVILGSEERILQIKNRDIFGAAAPTPPAGLATFMEAKDIYRQQRARLQERISTFLTTITPDLQFDSLPNYPCFSFTDELLVAHLSKHNIIITHFRYPDEEAAPKSRIVLSAHHTPEDILVLTQALNTFKK